MPNVTDNLNELKTFIDTLYKDAEKHDRGQKAAGTRLRKGLQELRTACQTLRVSILAERKDEDSSEENA